MSGWCGGEAYFEVVHDKTPFTVCANRYVVRDIGTAFAVHLMDEGLVNVRVTKGSVEIAAPRRRGGADAPKSLGVFVAGAATWCSATRSSAPKSSPMPS